MSKEEIIALVLTFLAFVVYGTMLLESQKPEPKREPMPAITSYKVKPVQRATKTSRSFARTGYKYTVQTNTPSKRYAVKLVSDSQWPCLHELWMRESGWSPTSDNPTSSAFGIPQILGLEKRTGTNSKAQVQAGLNYIRHRYGTPCAALSFHFNHGWY